WWGGAGAPPSSSPGPGCPAPARSPPAGSPRARPRPPACPARPEGASAQAGRFSPPRLRPGTGRSLLPCRTFAWWRGSSGLLAGDAADELPDALGDDGTIEAQVLQQLLALAVLDEPVGNPEAQDGDAAAVVLEHLEDRAPVAAHADAVLDRHHAAAAARGFE